MQGFGHGDTLLLNWVLARHAAATKLVEFGTFAGTTALWLAMAARLRGGTVATFDNVDVRHAAVVRAWLPDADFFLADLEHEPLDSNALAAVQQADLLFVDAGDKHVEVRLWAKHLRAGALLLVHDWLASEAQQAHPISLYLESLGFEAAYESLAQRFESCLRVWIRTSAVVETS